MAKNFQNYEAISEQLRVSIAFKEEKTVKLTASFQQNSGSQKMRWRLESDSNKQTLKLKFYIQ